MKASRVLLRWYKSFNINYLGYDDRRHGVQCRPWNRLSSEADAEAYRFIEIPLQPSITTIVGANESGKSHLLSAISKVVLGTGIPEDDGTASDFSVTDLCHYASVRSKNADVWPNIGLEFVQVDAKEMKAVVKAAGGGSSDKTSFTLMLCKDAEHEALLYFPELGDPVKLSTKQLKEVRACLPQVEFIQSTVPLSDEVAIDDLLAGSTNGVPEWFSFRASQEAAKFLSTFSVGPDSKVSPDVVSQISKIKSLFKRDDDDTPKSPTLERQLFCDVLGIKPETLELLASTKRKDRGFAEGLVSIWNEELERAFNLSHFWQQDDQFALRVNYKDRLFYFEITDKTGAVYTFRERSSGLRFFLSYYIQAKSLEARYKDKGCIILMDEPDSFLSIAGQRNLLGVFESLVSAATANANLQLLYTTHSPFLINRNFPNRIRLVRKGDAEEGTQYVDESRLRRYEPVRSALGIDCAQTLFMGEANLVLEGPADQLLIAEAIRMFSMCQGPENLLDLSSVIVMSAESAPGVAQVLAASQWGDERIPATVVLFDADEEGQTQRKRVTGKGKSKKLIEEEFVLNIAEVLGETTNGQQIVTTEDLVPVPLYKEAVQNYLATWYPEEAAKHETDITAALSETSYGAAGLVASTNQVFTQIVHPGRKEYDKFGVLQEVLRLVKSRIDAQRQASPTDAKSVTDDLVAELYTRTKGLCEELRRRIERSRQASRRASGSQTIVRVIKDFYKRFKNSAPAFDIELLLDRLEREAKFIGEDAATLLVALEGLLHEIGKFREAGHVNVEGANWECWNQVIWSIKSNPLAPEVAKLPQPRTAEPEAESAT